MTLNIAVVDDIETDSRRICQYIEQYFSKCRNITIRVSTYSSAGKFLAEYLKGVFQIVFLDIRMEEINGLELANRLRIADRDISIVFMSSVRGFILMNQEMRGMISGSISMLLRNTFRPKNMTTRTKVLSHLQRTVFPFPGSPGTVLAYGPSKI